MNPFKQIINELSDTEFTEVTMPYLAHINKILNEPSIIVQTYGETFQVLEFLATAKAIEMVKDDKLQTYKIRKIK